MALDLAPMTELEAVNAILAAIGDSPVNSLSGTGLANASLARQELHTTSRDVQKLGWQFNFETNVLYKRDNEGYINLGSDVLLAKPATRDRYRDLTKRGLRLYDKKNRTFVFDNDVYLDRILFLSWDDLPPAAHSYITIAAARKFQRGFIGSGELNSISQEDEQKALVALKDAEGETLDADFLSGAYPFNMLKSRRVPV